VRHTWKNAAHLEKCGTLGKMRHTWQSAAPLAKCGTFGKVQHTWQNAAHLAKCGTLGKVRHTWKSAAHLAKCGTWKSAPHMEKCATNLILHFWTKKDALVPTKMVLLLSEINCTLLKEKLKSGQNYTENQPLGTPERLISRPGLKMVVKPET